MNAPGVLAEHGAWMLEMRMLRAETPADGISAAGKYCTSASPGSFYLWVYPTPCTRNEPDVASWQIVLQKSQKAQRLISRQRTKQARIADQ